MDTLHRELDSLSNDLNNGVGTSTKEGIKAGANILAFLLNRAKQKSPTVTRQDNPEKDSPELTIEDEPGFTITKKESDSPDLDPAEQIKTLIKSLNKSLANQVELKDKEIDVDGTTYKINKFKGGMITVESENSRVSYKNDKIDIRGDQAKLANDLPKIVSQVEESLGIEKPRSKINNPELLYGFDKNNKFIEKPLNQEDAKAILDLMEGREGNTLDGEGAKNLLIEYNGQKLFETDEKGQVTYNIYDHNPDLLNSIKLRDEKGLNKLKDYAKRMASGSPEQNISVKRVESPPVSQTAQQIAPNTPIGQDLNYKKSPTTELNAVDYISTVNEKLLQSNFAGKSLSKRVDISINGTKFSRNSKTKNGTNSITMKAPGKNSVMIGRIGQDGNFTPENNLSEREDIKESLAQILSANEIAPQRYEKQKLEPVTVVNEHTTEGEDLNHAPDAQTYGEYNQQDEDLEYDPAAQIYHEPNEELDFSSQTPPSKAAPPASKYPPLADVRETPKEVAPETGGVFTPRQEITPETGGGDTLGQEVAPETGGGVKSKTNDPERGRNQHQGQSR